MTFATLRMDKIKRLLRKSPLLLIFISVLLFQGCIKNNPDPSWIEISKWTVQTNPNPSVNLGDMSLSNFTDAWVMIDGKLIGVFELPVKIPVLISGNAKIEIYPAVKNNGISATKKIYPYMDPYEMDVELVQNQTVSLSPVTQYNSFTKAYIEDFEDLIDKIEDAPNQSNSLVIGSDPAISNSDAYGWVHLDEANPTWTGYTNFPLNLPRGAEVYLEIDYRNTSALVTGLISISSEGTKNNPNIQLNAQEPGSDVWKKIYIDLREIISASPSDAYFEISLQCDLPAGLTEADIYIDNIRVVHF